MSETKEKSKPKKKEKIVVLDADDTIFDFLGGLCKVHNKRNGTCITPADIEDWNFESLEMKDARGNVVKGVDFRKTFTDYEADGLYVGLDILGDADFALELIKKLGYKIIILTARDDKYGKQTELNLIFNRISSYVDDIFFKADKVKKIKELSKVYHVVMFVDDRATTVASVLDNCNVDKVFLVDKGHNKTVELDEEIIRVKDLYGTVKYLKDLNR